jgi:hypothetical protein
MIFQISYYSSDTCGNTWSHETKPTRFLKAKNIKDAWKKLGKPFISEYTVDDKQVHHMRTPKGKGYGIWESNPAFNWTKAIDKATTFNCGGDCGGIVCEEIKIEDSID